MALQGIRKKVKTHGGKKTVKYRDSRGRTFDAVVTGPGTGQTLNLRIRDFDRKVIANQILANVPLATAIKGAGSTGVYFNRIS